MGANISTYSIFGRNTYPHLMNTQLLKEYGWRIKTYLKKEGQSLSEVAMKLEMSRVGFSQALDRNTLTVQKMAKLAELFGFAHNEI